MKILINCFTPDFFLVDSRQKEIMVTSSALGLPDLTPESVNDMFIEPFQRQRKLHLSGANHCSSLENETKIAFPRGEVESGFP